MSQREMTRAQVLALVQQQHLSVAEAAERLGLSVRQVRRLLQRFARGGAAAVIHGNRDRPAANRIDAATQAEILRLRDTHYAACNDVHLQELLAFEHQIRVSRATLRTLLRASGRPAKQRRRGRTHRQRRERAAAKGLLVLWDGSDHRWFGPAQPRCTLMGVIDDADSELLAAVFVPHESSAAYLLLLDQLLTAHGVPATIYQDRHGALRRNDAHWTVDEQLAGAQDPTQVGAVLESLGIHVIFAHSPQAKGRIERVWRTLQDRLVVDLARAGVTTLAEANAYLPGWLRGHHARVQRPAPAVPAVFRRLSAAQRRAHLVFRYAATVSQDNVVTLGGLVIAIPPGPHRRSYARAHVEVCQHLDGAWSVRYHDTCIATAPATPLREIQSHRRRPRTSPTPRADIADAPTPHPRTESLSS